MQSVPAIPSFRERQTILVVGMHRSGTSVLTRLINLMAAYVGDGDELLPSHPIHNPTGYWERMDLVTEHECFLQKNGYEWCRLAGFDLNRVQNDSVAVLRRSLGAICARIDSGGRPFLIKDPRLCLLLPIWHSLGPAPVHVFAVRDPRKIAASMLKSFYGMFTAHFLLALWQKHMHTALSRLRGQRVLFVSYEELLDSAQAQSERVLQGLSDLGIRGLQAVAQAESHNLIERKLDRSATPAHIEMSQMQSELYSWLLRQCASADPVAIDELPRFDAADDVLREFECVREESTRRGFIMATQRGRASATG